MIHILLIMNYLKVIILIDKACSVNYFQDDQRQSRGF